jgi:hypothetical protein
MIPIEPAASIGPLGSMLAIGNLKEEVTLVYDDTRDQS